MRKWMCVLCGFIYDEQLGLPSEGIPAGTAWAQVPDDWRCSDCGAGKSDFEMVEVGQTASEHFSVRGIADTVGRPSP